MSENHELLYKTINFLILAAGLVFLLRKPLSEFFSQRSASIRKSLEEGRQALEAARAQLAAVEEKFSRLADEIEAFKATARREMADERERLRQATAEEAKNLLDAARARMETVLRATKLELKAYAAEEALRAAERIIRERLNEAAGKRLVSQFINGLPSRPSGAEPRN